MDKDTPEIKDPSVLHHHTQSQPRFIPLQLQLKPRTTSAPVLRCIVLEHERQQSRARDAVLGDARAERELSVVVEEGVAACGVE